jgi:hypothetical protein
VKPAKPPPSCDSLDDHCVVASDTRVKIQNSGWSLVPPAGWTYAHEPDATIAAAADAVLAITVYDAPNRKTEAANRNAALELVLRKMSVTSPKKMNLFARSRPDQIEKIASLKLSLYQVEGTTREEKRGALLVLAMKLPPARGLVGAGFVAESDTADSDQAILSAVKSLMPQPSEAADGGAGHEGGLP